MKKLYLIINIATAITLMACSKCSETPAQDTTRPVKTTTISKSSSTSTSKISGTIHSNTETYPSFKTAGTIVKIHVQEGDHIKKGALIAELDNSTLQQTYEAAKSKYEQTNSEVSRVIQLYEKGSVAKNEYEKAISGLQTVTSLYEISKNNIANTRLISPISGTIQEILLGEGQMATPASSVVNITADDQLSLHSHISASQYLNKDNILRCYATSSIIPDTIPLKISFISAKANNNQLHKIRFDIPKKYHNTLSLGMILSVSIQSTNTDKDNLTIPISACFIHEGKTHVWIVDKKTMTVHRQQITTNNINHDGYIKVSHGLKGNETIVTAGTNMLNPNDHIRLTK